MNGRQMADAGREVRPGLKTLFITGYAESAALGNSSLGAGMQVLTAVLHRHPCHPGARAFTRLGACCLPLPVEQTDQWA